MTATLADGRALLRAVIDDPDDTAVRLVYADWLEENGEGERAEFIRVQCEFAELVERQTEFDKADISHFDAERAAVDKRQETLRKRARGLHRKHADAWFIDLLGPCPWEEYRTGRGFVESVSLACADWLARGPRLVRSAPLRSMRLTDREPLRLESGPWVGTWFLIKRDIPEGVWQRLPDPHGVFAYFDSAEEAHAALSVACLSWARSTEPTP